MKGFRLILLAIVAVFCSTANAQSNLAEGDAADSRYGKVSYNHEKRQINAGIEFRINSHTIDKDAQRTLSRFAARLDSITECDSIISVKIKGTSSPDGPYRFNERLASDRANTLFMYLFCDRYIDRNIIGIEIVAEDWETLRCYVSSDKSLPFADKALEIIDSSKSEELKEKSLKNLGGGMTWRYLRDNIFPKLRSATITVDFLHSQPLVEIVEFDRASANVGSVSSDDNKIPVTVISSPDNDFETSMSDSFNSAAESSEYSPEWGLQMSVKSNLPVWLAAMPNIAVEFDLAHHFSIAASVYYSGWNYFKNDIKFRNLTIMPELRYWPKRDNVGFFIGVHGGVAWYNVALGGDHRYQDHNGNTPAFGGGVNLGYKFPLRSKHWSMEVSVGAGAWKLDYDIFVNEQNGKLTGRRKRMMYGIDNAALSICYHFGLGKKGGMR